jgi:hypothetical protein
MVGRARVELATSRLSGVRSNHLSYRPISNLPATKAVGAQEGQLRLPRKIDKDPGVIYRR